MNFAKSVTLRLARPQGLKKKIKVTKDESEQLPASLVSLSLFEKLLSFGSNLPFFIRSMNDSVFLLAFY